MEILGCISHFVLLFDINIFFLETRAYKILCTDDFNDITNGATEVLTLVVQVKAYFYCS